MSRLNHALLFIAAVLVVACSGGPVKKSVEGASTASTYALREGEIRALTSEAGAGSAQAAWRLWLYYSLSAHDDERALACLRRAAELGHGVAQFNLAVRLTEDASIRDLDQAESWLNKSEGRVEVDEDFPDLNDNLRKRINELRQQAKGK